MQTKIIATLTQTRDRKPLATVSNPPRDDADLTPLELRALARALCAIADESEAMPMNPKRFSPRKREYLMASV